MNKMPGSLDADHFEPFGKILFQHCDFMHARIHAAVERARDGESRYGYLGGKQIASASAGFGARPSRCAVVAKCCAFNPRERQGLFDESEFFVGQYPARGPVSPQLFNEGPVAAFDHVVRQSWDLEEGHVPRVAKLARQLSQSVALQASHVGNGDGGE